MEIRPLARHRPDAASAWPGCGQRAGLSSARHDRKRTIDRTQDAVELMPAAHDEAGGGDHTVDALAACELWILLDAVDRNFGAAAKDREHRAILQKINCIVAPLTSCDLAAIKTKQAIELPPIERHLLGGDEARGHLAPKGLAWFFIAWTNGHRRLLLELIVSPESLSLEMSPGCHADDRAGRRSRQGCWLAYLWDQR